MFCCTQETIFIHKIIFSFKLQNDQNYLKRQKKNKALKYAATAAGVGAGIGLGAFALSRALNSGDGSGDGDGGGGYDEGDYSFE